MGRGRGKKGQKKQEQNSVEKINGQMYAGVRKANALADAKNAQEDEDELLLYLLLLTILKKNERMMAPLLSTLTGLEKLKRKN